MNLNRWTILWLVAVVALLIILVFEVAGVFRIEDLIANPVLFLVAFVVVAVLSAVGAMFIGVFVTHRIFASSDFTPFEREMLSMRQEVKAMREELDKFLRVAEERKKD